uniref:Neuroendocrine convertase 2-like isoform X2 n=1 Tax=Crassostrea virginica TaxID=6565 RepID=A0A8B8D6N5_CRAVI|nr:neuroendocrine convertase 2-like isoform X2 [Crassostrea virginica]
MRTTGYLVHMILLPSNWASCLMFLTILNTSASSILNSKLELGPREVEFAVLAENQEAVMEFCQGGGCTYVGQITTIYYHIKCPTRKVEKFGGEKKMKEIAKKFYKIQELHMQRMHKNYPRTNDPRWAEMWPLNGAVQPSLKVTEAWSRGYNGQGISIAVVDNGVQADHPDLMKRFDLFNSFDYRDPSTHLNDSESHGTPVAGLMAAEANNSVCIVGVAYACKIIDVRLIGGETSDIMEAKALRHHLKVVDIYSNSWGPIDKICYNSIGPVTESALIDGVTLGRNGKGSIYVYAAGNGGPKDNCNADGYINSVYTIPITSIGVDGKATSYAEVCASAFAAIYSGTTDLSLTSTSRGSDCKVGLEGTSFSAPQASGIVALTLQANPSLTWRDIQHLIVQTSKRYNIEDGFEKQSWQINGAGYHVSQVVGFGLMDAEAMVTRAKAWTLVNPQVTCLTATKEVDMENVYVDFSNELRSYISETGKQCSISSLEYVQVEVFLTFSSRRGDISLILTSPSGTKSYLMTPRPYDSELTEFEYGTLLWKFSSVHFWGEDIRGTWKLTMKRGLYPYTPTANLQSWKLLFYGTSNGIINSTNFKEKTTVKPDGQKEPTPAVTWEDRTTVDFWNIGGNQDTVSPEDDGEQTENSGSSGGLSPGVYGIIVGVSVVVGLISVICRLYFRRLRHTRNLGTTVTRPRIFVTQSSNYNRI